MKIVLRAAACAAFVATPAFAAEHEEKCFDKGTLSYVDCPKAVEPVAAPAPIEIIEAPSWSGFYIGAHAGYAWADMQSSQSVPAVPLSASQDYDVDGFLVGGQIGGQHQFSNNVVLGAEIDASAVFADDSVNAVVGGFPLSTEAELDFLASARIRLGYAAGDFLPYVTGGVALAQWDSDASSPGAFNVSFDETAFGGVVGGGLQYMVTENWIIGAEGLFYFFNDEETESFTAVAPNARTFPGTADAELNHVFAARVRLDYKF